MDEFDAKIARVAKDPGTPYWARDIITVALTKDPVDAASVLDHLAELFNERCEAVLAEALRGQPLWTSNIRKVQVMRGPEDREQGADAYDRDGDR